MKAQSQHVRGVSSWCERLVRLGVTWCERLCGTWCERLGGNQPQEVHLSAHKLTFRFAYCSCLGFVAQLMHLQCHAYYRALRLVLCAQNSRDVMHKAAFLESQCACQP